MITVTSFGWVPDFARGQVRDVRVRWALEEAGLPYDNRLIDGETQGSPGYRREQPFGQVPVIDDNGVGLFESGAIVLHIGRHSEALLPPDEAGRSRAVSWAFAALNSIEPFVMQLAEIDLFAAGEEWAKLRRPSAEAFLRQRIGQLSAWLGDREYLEHRFTAGDLLMASVLRILDHTDIVKADPRLGPYRERCLARPAFTRAYDAHMASFGAA
jgi:glutathione S-transferase